MVKGSVDVVLISDASRPSYAFPYLSLEAAVFSHLTDIMDFVSWILQEVSYDKDQRVSACREVIT